MPNKLQQDRFVDFLNTALTLGASSKTNRYFLRDEKVPEFCSKLLNTVVQLSQVWGDNNKIVVDGYQYDINEYKLPKFAIDIIKLGRVYVNEKAALLREPVIKIQSDSDVKEYLTPTALKRFVDRYNENQVESNTLSLLSVEEYRPTLLTQVGSLRCGSDTFVVNDSGDAQNYSLTGLLAEVWFDENVAKYYPSVEPELDEVMYHAIFN